MDTLDDYRKQVDMIDRQLIFLFEQRMNVIADIAEHKKRYHMPILHPTREQEVLERTANALVNPAYRNAAADFMRNTMRISREYQATKNSVGLPRMSNVSAHSEKANASANNNGDALPSYSAVITTLSQEAVAVGAVTAVVKDEDVVCGYNTDYFGFRALLVANEIDPSGKTFVVLGNDVAARPVFACLKELGANEILCVGNICGDHFAFEGVTYLSDDALEHIHGYALIVTPQAGLYPHTGVSPVGERIIANFDCLIDLLDKPLNSEFLRLGQSLGKKTCGGLHMLIGKSLHELEQSSRLTSYEGHCSRAVGDGHATKLEKSILLIGLPGSGKSTIGRLVSKKLGLPFYNMDDTILHMTGKTVPQLFAISEDAFRDAETDACRLLAQRGPSVIACGGGVIKRPENIKILEAAGDIIFIDRPVAHIAADIDISARPLLKEGTHKLYELENERRHIYEKAASRILYNTGTAHAAASALGVLYTQMDV